MNAERVLQQDIDRHIAAREYAKARLALTDLWNASPGPALAGFILSRSKLIEDGAIRRTCRVAFIRSYTIEPAVAVLGAAASVNGIDVVSHVGDFNTYAQEMLDGSSSLYQFKPEIVILATQTRDISPDLWSNISKRSILELRTEIARIVNNYRNLVTVFRKYSQAHLIIHNLELPLRPTQGVMDAQIEQSQTVCIQEVNRGLKTVAQEHSGVYVLDYDTLISRHGRTRWHDEKKWLTMRMPITAGCLIHLANEWLRYLHPLIGKVCKALVVDLDNTLWGGVVGEAGLTGIQCGLEYPGAAFLELHRVILDLRQRGIILAVCSKNNFSDAIEALKNHTGLLLRPEHFAAMRINWKPKSENIREIAKELNIGTDAVAFLDDNPAEQHHVRLELPEVTVIKLPPDILDYALSLRESPVFERLSLSQEDRDRGQIYQAQRQRLELREHSGSLDDFNRSLQQEVEIAYATPDTIPRISQLTQKTNQFNLTTRRYTEQQIIEINSDKDWMVITAQVRDRFGDNGLVGLAMVRLCEGVCEIDTFLLSCRVIGRAVETVILAYLIQEAKSRGSKEIRGLFIETAKNAPAKDFFAKHGFSESAKDGCCGTYWSLNTETSSVISPEWTKVIGPRTTSGPHHTS